MKITHPHVAYSDIPRLVQEGVIKVGTRVKACDDQEKYPNGLNYTLRNNMIGTISRISDDAIDISRDDEDGMIMFVVSSPFFLDILSDEEQEPNPLSFSEPLTKEAVGRWVIDRYHNRRCIIEIALSGEAFRTSLEDGTEAVWTREEAEEKGFAFTTPPEHPDEISIEEAEKLTGKKIKRV